MKAEEYYWHDEHDINKIHCIDEGVVKLTVIWIGDKWPQKMNKNIISESTHSDVHSEQKECRSKIW